MKALFIIHCQDPIYGASRSVGNLIRNLDADVDIIFPFKVKRDGITKEQIKQFYGSRVGKVWFLPQPAKNYLEPHHFSYIHDIKSFVKDILYALCRPVYSLIYRRGYDFIHLNSSSVYPMLNSKYPMFIHMRESIKPQPFRGSKRFHRCLGRACGMIFISKEVEQTCASSDAPGIVLINPYDQSRLDRVDVDKARKRFELNGSETVYAIIGNIFPKKGVDFTIRAFRQAQLDNAVLLVIGKDTNNDGYEAEVRKEADGDPRIRFLGEISDMDEVYRVVDYVVRGDSETGAGRTVFESLYSGGGVLLMGTREDNLAPLELPAHMQERVHFYPVRDRDALARAFEATQHCRFDDRQFISNIPEYIERFTDFIMSSKDRMR